MNHVVHAHPLESLRPGLDPQGGGPTLSFEALLPEAGTYRIWTQIKRRGQVSTAVFTVSVLAGEAQGRSRAIDDPRPHRHGGE